MFLTYLKNSGKLVPPMLTSDKSLTLEEVWGTEKAKIYEAIYDYINIEDELEIIYNPNNYYVDIETKKLKLKVGNVDVDIDVKYLD